MPAPEENKMIAESPSASETPGRFSVIANELDQVRSFISEQMITSSHDINVLLEPVASRSGKMLRPALVLLSGKSCGNITETHIKVASVIEIIHIATLLHDDVIDEAKSRRNATTVNVLSGNECAVLLGDFLLSKVFAVCARIESPQIAKSLADTTVRICHGELIQNTQRHNWRLSRQEYLDIVMEKTAALFASCCYLGGLASGADQKQLAALSDFGLKVGIAFQITDDLLDIIGDESSVGKTLGTDLAKRKLTLPVIHLLNHSDPGQKAMLIKELSAAKKPEHLQELLDEAGSIQYTRSMAEKFCIGAKDSIGSLGDFEGKKALLEIADYITTRDA
jgi:octaprenyl-diphosphate synthase